MTSPQTTTKAFGGLLHKYTFPSRSLGGLPTSINVFLPPSSPSSSSSTPIPVLYYLSGLTCTEDNAAQKGGLFSAAADERIALVFPDTSPRGAKIEGEDDSYDFGTGAGFYLNATKQPYSGYYRMYEYVTEELPSKLEELGLGLDTSRASILGHSMGGHGALTLYLRNRHLYRSCSAFSPICHPTVSPWGQKAFSGYLADPATEAEAYDATKLVEKLEQGTKLDILVDCGRDDDFYKQGQLRPEDLERAAKEKGVQGVEVRLHDGYDHSYYFVSTFAAEHVKWHAKFLKA
ncbi:hypothetical protein ACQY0O_004886 [Thecaphora frezii]|nr:putative carbohydrate esterase family 1 protein [Thecaphora frezii]